MKAFLVAVVAFLFTNTTSAWGQTAATVDEVDTFFHVNERGLSFDDGLFFDGRQQPVPLDTRFPRDDSMYFAPILSGWEVEKGMVTMVWKMRVLSASGKLLYEGGTGGKTVERYPIAMVNDVPFMIELAKIRTNDPYYTVEFSITDKVSKNGVEGNFRILLQ